MNSLRTIAFGLSAIFRVPLLSVAMLILVSGVAGLFELALFPWFDALTARELVGTTVAPASEAQENAFSIAAVLAGVSGVWLLLQLRKRKTASWGSWLPTLYLLPGIFLAASLAPMTGEVLGPTQGPQMLFAVSVGLLHWIFVAGFAATLWVMMGAFAVDPQRFQVSGWTSALWRGWAVYGATALVVWTGLQAMFIPGVWYAVSFAVAPHAAVLGESSKPMRTSEAFVKRRRRLVMGVILWTFLLGLIGHGAAMIVADFVWFSLGRGSSFVDGGEYGVGRVIFGWVTYLVAPGMTQFPVVAVLAGAFTQGMVNAACIAGLSKIYLTGVAKKTVSA